MKPDNLYVQGEDNWLVGDLVRCTLTMYVLGIILKYFLGQC